MSERPDYVEDKEERIADLTDDEKKIYEGKTMPQIATEIRTYWTERNELKKTLAEKNKKFEQLSKYLAERMESAQMTGFKVADVGTVFIGVDNKPYLTDKDAAFAWFKANGEGAIVKEAVHPSTLLGWVNERLAQNLELPDCVGNFTLKRAKIRKS